MKNILKNTLLLIIILFTSITYSQENKILSEVSKTTPDYVHNDLKQTLVSNKKNTITISAKASDTPLIIHDDIRKYLRNQALVLNSIEAKKSNENIHNELKVTLITIKN